MRKFDSPPISPKGMKLLKRQPLQDKLYEIIFGTETPAGKGFDIALLWAILLSVLAVMLESVKPLREEYGDLFTFAEWFFTVLFSIEFALRIWSTHRTVHYVFSFYGIIDLLSLLPTYLGLFITGSHYLLVIRAIRLLRVFRILKLARFIGAGQYITQALHASRHKILVFLGVVLSSAMIMGTLMYMIEGEENGFSSIPRSIYWAIVTLTTVGYGDIAPQTVLGQFMASVIMILGYAIIAVPTGIVSVEMGKLKDLSVLPGLKCSRCQSEGHLPDAHYCRICAERLPLQGNEAVK